MSHIDAYPSLDHSDRTTAIGMNLLAVLIVLALGVVLAWALVAGPIESIFNTDVYHSLSPVPGVEQPKSNPPGQQPQHAPQHPVHFLDEQQAVRFAVAGFEII